MASQTFDETFSARRNVLLDTLTSDLDKQIQFLTGLIKNTLNTIDIYRALISTILKKIQYKLQLGILSTQIKSTQFVNFNSYNFLLQALLDQQIISFAQQNIFVSGQILTDSSTLVATDHISVE